MAVGLLVLISNTETNYGLCVSASLQIIRELRAPTVMAYSRSIAALPEPARQTLENVDRGRYIPYAFVMNPEMTELIALIKYEDIKADSRKVFREVKKTIRAY